MQRTLLLSAGLLGLSIGVASAQPSPAAPYPDTSQGATAAPDTGNAAPPPATRHRRHYRPRRQAAQDTAQPAYDPANPPGGAAPADQFQGVPPTGAYQGGAGSPFSPRAANITGSDTRSVIAPRLPNPDASGNTPRDYLRAARRALAANQTGAAQEALERAQTRILTRSTDPAMANQPDDAPVSQAITDARRALASNDPRHAMMAIDAVLNR